MDVYILTYTQDRWFNNEVMEVFDTYKEAEEYMLDIFESIKNKIGEDNMVFLSMYDKNVPHYQGCEFSFRIRNESPIEDTNTIDIYDYCRFKIYRRTINESFKDDRIRDIERILPSDKSRQENQKKFDKCISYLKCNTCPKLSKMRCYEYNRYIKDCGYGYQYNLLKEKEKTCKSQIRRYNNAL